MTAHIFDGKKEARKVKNELKKKISLLDKKGIRPKLVSIVVGEDKSSMRYLALKKSAAQSIGADVLIRDFPKNSTTQDVMRLIQDLNVKEDVEGVMLQLPLPNEFSKRDEDQIISAISKNKDVDGMNSGSKYPAPVVKAVLAAFNKAQEFLQGKRIKIVVLGSEGFVGSKIYRAIKNTGYEVIGIDKRTKGLRQKTKTADVLISAVGKKGIVKNNMVKTGVVAIDVGEPKPDFDDGVKGKAAFVTPVPGGIGPLTVAYLLDNLVEAAYKKIENTQSN